VADLIDNLIGYVNDIKPYHTKIFGVEVEYVTTDDITVDISEKCVFNIDLGLPVCDDLISIAVASGDDDGWDTKPYDQLPFDIILADNDGFCIPRNTTHSSIVFNGQVYEIPTGFYDYVFTTISETIQIQGQIVTGNVDDDYTQVQRPWDAPLNGMNPVEYGTNYFKIDNDVSSIFNTISQNGGTTQISGVSGSPITGNQVFISSSSLNDGVYTVLSATYDPIVNETTITLLENTLDPSIPDGVIVLGMFDAYEWDGNPITAVEQPPADINAKSFIAECFTIQDGYGYDDPNVGWDATVDATYVVPPGEEHNPAFFDIPAGWDDGQYIINGSSGPQCAPLSGMGWDGQTYDSVHWDAMYTVPPEPQQPTGIVVFSAEDIPIPNPSSVGSLFTQTTASNMWVVDHNLGYYPIVRVFSGGFELIPTSIVHTSLNQVVISFNSGQVGQARLV